jgi:hypothetical protein
LARRDISIVVDGACGTEEARAELNRNPKAGLILRGSDSAAAVRGALRSMVQAAEPSELDERLWRVIELPLTAAT